MERLGRLLLVLGSWWLGGLFASLAWASAPASPLVVVACVVLAIAGLAAPPVVAFTSGPRRLHEDAVTAVVDLLDGRLGRAPLTWNGVFAGLALFVEMSVIRWTSGLLPELNGLRNFALLACFLGLGLGLLTGRRRPAFVPYLLPLLALHHLQAAIGAARGEPASFPAQFVLIVLATLPAGQLVGHLLARRSDLGGYGANLAGSLAGVAAAHALSALWTGPAAWLLVAALAYLAAFHERRFALTGLATVLLALAVAGAAQVPGAVEVWSPYQRLVVTPAGIGHTLGDGYLAVEANGRYYQTISTIRAVPTPDLHTEHLGPVRGRLQGKRVLALGTGAGMNLPALLRGGVASIVAVDIDPAIVHLGRSLNGERPFDDPRVRVVVDDARAFLRRAQEQFDLIAFFWIDTHPGGASSAGRLDTFVYTRECFADCAARLAPGGNVLLYTWMSAGSARRIRRAFGEALTGHTVSAFRVAPHDPAWLFTAGDVDPTGGSTFVTPAVIAPDAIAGATLVTDDWPFLYVAEGPGTALLLLQFLALLAVVSLAGVALAVPRAAGPATGDRVMFPVFFLFGAAFMLVETVSIVQAALLFGNTWTTIGAVVVAVLIMAFAGNLVVLRGLLPARPGAQIVALFVGLLLALLATYAIRPDAVAHALGGGTRAAVAYLALAASPVLFSSVLFSLALREETALDGALGANLLGAMAGGCLEYTAMLVGYHALTLGVIALYGLAGAAWLLARRARPSA